MSVRDYGMFAGKPGQDKGCPLTYYDSHVEMDFEIFDLESVMILDYKTLIKTELAKDAPCFVTMYINKFKLEGDSQIIVRFYIPIDDL